MDRDLKGKFIKGHKNFRIKRIGFCSVNDCKKSILSRGFCGQHYQRNKKYGNPLEPYKGQGRPNSGNFFNCLYCGKKFYRPLSQVKKGRVKFCSHQCDGLSKKGKLQNIIPIEKRNWRINKQGYLETTMRREKFLQHRWIMEKHLGRKLTNKEFVHHLNGNKKDNNINNLIILDSGLHSSSHRQSVKENKIMKQLLLNIVKNNNHLNRNWTRNVKFYLQKAKG